MYVAIVPNRSSPPAILLRESYREDGKVRSRTLANLSDWPAEKVEALRAVLRNQPLVPASRGSFEIRRSLPHGHVAAALATARCIGLDDLLPRRGKPRQRRLALALIVARLLDPAAKLATARMLDAETASHSLGEVLDLGQVSARELYATLDWLVSEQPSIEATLARRHLHLPGRALLSAGPARLQPRPPRRPTATGDRPAVRRQWLPDRGRGVRRQHRGSGNLGAADPNAAAALQTPSRGGGGRPRHDHRRPDRADAAPGGAGLDQRIAGAGNLATRGRRRTAAMVAVRPARHGRDRQPRLPRRAAGGVPQPAAGRGTQA